MLTDVFQEVPEGKILCCSMLADSTLPNAFLRKIGEKLGHATVPFENSKVAH